MLTDFEKLEQGYDCDPKCWFLEEYINSTTISKWPVNCTDVCGIVRFDRNSDLTNFELQEYFKNLKVLKGELTFSNTEYASIDFLSSLEEVHCDVLNWFSFAFNRNLEVLDFGELTNVTCNFYAYNNSKLDATSFCDKYEDMAIMFIYSNKVDCKGCVSEGFYTNTLSQFEGCERIINYMWFTSFFIYEDFEILSPLKKIQNISGNLEAYNTDLRNFSFFESLENLRSNGIHRYDISIQQSPNMTRFGIPKLKSLTTTREHFLINIAEVHEDFCLTTSEMYFFLEQEVKFQALNAQYCVNDTLESLCIFDTISNLEDNCTEILGNVILAAKEEIYKDKLKNVKNVYGTLTIEGTSFTDLSFLGSLEYVAKLANDSTIPLQILSNKNLQDVSLPSLKRAFSKTKYQVSFDNNGDKILNSTACLDFMDNLFDTNVVFDGNLCEVIDRVEGEKNGVGRRTVLWIILYFLFAK